MPRRSFLLPPPLDAQTVQHLTYLADQIAETMNAGHNPTTLIASFNVATGQQFDAAAFHGAWEGGGTRMFVETILRPPPQKVPDITDAELLEIITYLVEGQGTASEQSYWIEFLERHLPHPEIASLIYWRFEEPSPVQILAEAKAYQPIRL
jgi:hypothetical protein